MTAPPWHLTGEGFILLGRFAPSETHAPDALQDRFRGGFGALMLVDYQTSAVGPYQELLYIPGSFEVNGRNTPSITRIWVTSQASVDAGRANWAIPKGLCTSTWEDLGDRRRRIAFFRDGQPLARFTLRTGRLSLPTTTALLPRSLRTLVQRADRAWVYTTPSASARVGLATLESIETDPRVLPGVETWVPRAVLHAKRFEMTFPEALEKPA